MTRFVRAGKTRGESWGPTQQDTARAPRQITLDVGMHDDRPEVTSCPLPHFAFYPMPRRTGCSRTCQQNGKDTHEARISVAQPTYRAVPREQNCRKSSRHPHALCAVHENTMLGYNHVRRQAFKRCSKTSGRTNGQISETRTAIIGTP
jgi:hypothetical protein